jgi:hypothetical protein
LSAFLILIIIAIFVIVMLMTFLFHPLFILIIVTIPNLYREEINDILHIGHDTGISGSGGIHLLTKIHMLLLNSNEV